MCRKIRSMTIPALASAAADNWGRGQPPAALRRSLQRQASIT